MRRFWARRHCRKNQWWARLHGIRWDGHCWDEDKRGVFCMDCGARG